MKRLLIAALAALALLAVGDGYLAWHLHSRHASVDQRQALLTRVKTVIPDVLSYSGPTITADTARAVADTTGDFKAQFEKAMATVVAPTAQRTGVVTKATVSAAGITSISGTSATALVFLDQTTTSKARPIPAVTGSRLSVDLTKVNGQWMVSGIKPL